MKIWTRYSLAFGLCIALFIALIYKAKNPEVSIEGEWKELVWIYENVDPNDPNISNYKNVAGYVKNVAGQDLIIHKAEKWKFLPNGKLQLSGNDYFKEINWTLKGRGNVLELKYDNNVEYYDLTELSDNKLVLNFETEIQTRGIACLTFEKI